LRTSDTSIATKQFYCNTGVKPMMPELTSYSQEGVFLMRKKHTIFAACIRIALLISFGSFSFASGTKDTPEHIRNVTAITEIFGDGQKISALSIEYDRAIKTNSLKITDFSVEGKKITKVYANTVAKKSAKGINGQYVIIELDTAVVPDAEIVNGNIVASDGRVLPMLLGFTGPKLGEKSDKPATPKILRASVMQKGDIITVSSGIYKASPKSITSTKTINLMIQDFKQLVYKDPNYANKQLMYNLFVPKNYDPSKKYPLVLFMHDAGNVSINPIETLTQGLGAVIWATPADQAKHECFVLAPQYACVIADDNSETTPEMDITVDLIKNLMKRYSIDPSRLYNTGQSMGGMISIAMDIKYPDLFAASLLVACQWDVAKITPLLAKKPLWIIISEGDLKAYPGENAITGYLKEQGATVSKAVWKAESTPREFDEYVRAMIADKSSINYTVFKNGNHLYTWQYAYSIEGVRDWLFAQKK
jgi:predicted peptidase